MKRYLWALLLLFSLSSKGQNLVPNGDFEDYISCPPNLSYIDYAIGWQTASEGTPDFFHACGNLWRMGVPDNQFGYQEAHSGNGYAGMYIWEETHGNPVYREYMEVQLKETLEPGKIYYFEMFFNVPNSYKYTSDQIGVYFSKTFVYQYSHENLSLIPQLENAKRNYPDTIGWTKMSALYVASGGEKFITIGAFNDDTKVDTVDINPSLTFKASYFYIDDVSLSINKPSDPRDDLQAHYNTVQQRPEPIDRDTLASENCIRIPNAFSPNNDGHNDLFCPLIPCPCLSYSLKIFNRYGQEVFASNNQYEKWDGKMKGRELGLGAYYYLLKVQINYANTKEELYKGDITLLR